MLCGCRLKETNAERKVQLQHASRELRDLSDTVEPDNDHVFNKVGACSGVPVLKAAAAGDPHV